MPDTRAPVGSRRASYADRGTVDHVSTGALSVRVRAEHFRVLDRFDWSPSGVCLLAGANGSGKSTALDTLWFLKALFERGHEAAFADVDVRAFRNVAAPEAEPVVFELVVGDLLWRLRFPMSAIGIKGTFGEELYRSGDIVVRAAMFQEGWFLRSEKLALDEVRCCARVLWDRESPAWMQDFVDVLSRLRVHPEYVLSRVRAPQPVSQRQRSLSSKGQNLWSVLSGWKAAPGLSAGRFEWVMEHARRAFPGLLSGVEFDPGGFPVLFPRGAVDPERSLPAERAADGLLVGLLHLTAIAGAERGAILAFDEPENHLHPYAIRSLLQSMRQRAEEKDLTIILTTHSPVVMNEFRDDLDQVYVLETSKQGTLPSRISDLHSEEWLAQARLGTLYDRLAFGAPPDAPRE